MKKYCFIVLLTFLGLPFWTLKRVGAQLAQQRNPLYHILTVKLVKSTLFAQFLSASLTAVCLPDREHKMNNWMRFLLLSFIAAVCFWGCGRDEINHKTDFLQNGNIVIVDSIILPQPESEYWYGGRIESSAEVVHYLLYHKPSSNSFELGSYSDGAGYRKIRRIDLYNDGLMGQRISCFGLLGDESILIITDGGIHQFSLEGELVKFAREDAPFIDPLNSMIHTVGTEDSVSGFLVSHRNNGRDALMTTDPDFYQKHKLLSFYSNEDLLYNNHVLEIDSGSELRSSGNPRGYYNFSSINASNRTELLVVCNPAPRYAVYSLMPPFELKEAADIPASWFQREPVNSPMVYTLYTTSSFTGVAIDEEYYYFSIRTGVPRDNLKKDISSEDGYKSFVKENQNYLILRERTSPGFFREIKLPAKVNRLVTTFNNGNLLFTQNTNELESDDGLVLYVAKAIY